MNTKWRKYKQTCFDVVFLCENIRACLFTYVSCIFPFSAHFYRPLHHNGKGSIIGTAHPFSTGQDMAGDVGLGGIT